VGDKILVTYGSWAGSTKGVAEAVAEEMRAGGVAVDVMRAKSVRNLSPYAAVVLGSAVRAGRLNGEARRFLSRHRPMLAQLPLALFVVCLTASVDTPKNREQTDAFLAALHKLAPEAQVVASAAFAGALLTTGPEYRRQPWFIRKIIAAMARSQTPDQRDWGKIRAWAAALPGKVALGSTPQTPQKVDPSA
jgi:menaquinone-dependent protoporphyrinogen oxidase